MAHDHSSPSHSHSGCGHHHLSQEGEGDGRLILALVINFGLTFVQIVGGALSGSLSLIADAIHNLSDAISLVIAFVARKIARRPSDAQMTFGYARVELVAAAINYTTLVMIALYLLYEAGLRFLDPQPIDGWIVVIIAAVAFVIDAATALLTYRMSKNSVNIRAAFLHNLVDALGSVAVIVGGSLILMYDWYIVDPIITVGISVYILWHVWADASSVIRPLMLGAPSGSSLNEIQEHIAATHGISEVHSLRYFAIDERTTGLTAHIILARTGEVETAEIKKNLKKSLNSSFGINFCVLEIEELNEPCPDQFRGDPLQT